VSFSTLSSRLGFLLYAVPRRGASSFSILFLRPPAAGTFLFFAASGRGDLPVFCGLRPRGPSCFLRPPAADLPVFCGLRPRGFPASGRGLSCLRTPCPLRFGGSVPFRFRRHLSTNSCLVFHRCGRGCSHVWGGLRGRRCCLSCDSCCRGVRGIATPPLVTGGLGRRWFDAAGADFCLTEGDLLPPRERQ
jgi:hypothetical protein